MTSEQEHLAVLERFEAIDLDDLDQVASLQTRFDRKYVLPVHRGVDLLHALHDDLMVLSIDGNCTFRYDTAYFDTPDLDSYLSTARRRRNRFKVRIRTYADAGLCMLEVKRKGPRGETVKVRTTHPVGANATLTPAAVAFVGDTLQRPGTASRLRPVLATTFERTTLLDRRDGSRATLDREIHLAAPNGKPIVLCQHSVFETKSIGVATAADRWLWRQGHRPTSFSKFCIGMALTHSELPANKWNRTLRRDLGWKPDHDRAVNPTSTSWCDARPQPVPALASG
jgi:hypothetical protein